MKWFDKREQYFTPKCDHDWEVLDLIYIHNKKSLPDDLREILSRDASIHNDRNDLNGNVYINLYGHRSRTFRWKWEKKVCLKCGKCVDGVKDLEEILIKEMNELKKIEQNRINRRKLAKKMWNECKEREEV